MEAAFHAMRLARIGEVVALVGAGQPHARLDPVVEHDLLGQSEAERLLEKLPVRFDVGGQTIEMIDPADIDAARGKSLRLVLQRRLQFGRRLVPFSLIVDFEDMAVGIMKLVGRAMAEFVLDPADAGARSLQRVDAARERLRAAGAERRVA